MRDGLVEREQNLRDLADALEEVRRGNTVLFLLEGEYGIGKTALLRAAARMARDGGVQVCEARCSDMERDFTFGVVRQLLQPIMSTLDSPEEVLGDSSVAAMQVISAPDESYWNAHEDVPYPVLDGLSRLIRRLATRGPVLIAVDDVATADRASLRFLAYLTRRLDGLPVMCLVTNRHGERFDDASLAAHFEDEPAWHVCCPARLSPDGTEQIIRRSLGHPDHAFRDACHKVTRGNPYLLTELVRALSTALVAPTSANVATVASQAPTNIAASARTRLARLAPNAQPIADALAVLGRDADAVLLAGICGLSEHSVRETIEMMARAGWVAAVEPHLFAWPIVATALYQALPASARSTLHTRAARFLLSLRASPGRLAEHLLNAKSINEAWAVDALRSAAREAAARGESKVAVAFLRRALAERMTQCVRTECVVDLAELLLSVDPHEAVREARYELDRIEDPGSMAYLSLALGQALERVGHFDEAVEVLDRAWSAVRAGKVPCAPDLGERLAVQRLLTSQLSLRTVRRVSAGEHGCPTGGGPHHLKHRGLLALGALREAGTAGAADLAVRWAGQALDRLAAAEPSRIPFTFAVVALTAADELEQALRRCEEMAEASRSGGITGLWVLSLGLGAMAKYRFGRLAEAREDALTALDMLDDTEQVDGLVGVVVATAAEILLELGSIDRACRLLAGFGQVGDLPELWSSNFVLASRARLRLALGNAEGALADLLECGRRLQDWHVSSPAIIAWRSQAALAMVACGEADRAHELADEDLALARRWNCPSALGAALRTAGLVTAGQAGITVLAEAVDVMRESPNRLERTRCLIELGSAQRRAGQRHDARDSLRAALQLAEQCGAVLMARRAREELLATGARPHRSRHFGQDSLTPAEQRVAAMAAQGRSNRQIAAELFVTMRTVETHLTRAYRKLGIVSRSELDVALFRHLKLDTAR